MLSHRLYARPFARTRAARRCLWCGGAVAAGPAIEIEEPTGTTEWRACSDAHADAVRRFFGWAAAHRMLVQAGILGALAAFLAASAAASLPGAPAHLHADAVNAFRLAISAIVLPLSLLFTRRRAGPPPIRAPFPVHIQALLGTRATAWLFRLVGAAWLVVGVAYFAGRF
jgi:hypothetical protein